ncbi:N-acetylneuraminate synthase [Thiomicrospira microaerophila]|uniref:N-acetylneuraminate synthase n=1 Tax=Thiomicrospira microaerophila TaxID=406020 RepID=UPI0005CB38CB|nr:N-acetylneuraminate synthase [Thiomicrospira microaerophila]
MTNSVFIIAEAGVNHNGSIDLAKQLVDVAVEAGANAVKFQTFKTEQLVTQAAQQADYQTANTGVKESQFSMLKRLELTAQNHLDLIAYCQHKNIEFMSTPFDMPSIELLHRLGMPRWKIPSGEITNYPYLKQIGGYNKQVILSTGMAVLADIEAAIEVLIAAGTARDNLTLLHATTDYPTQMHDVNLLAIQTMAQAFKLKVGYSDHTPGIEVPTAAVALGASIIEKHFTLDKTLPGPDHKASLEPHELNAMIRAIRSIEIALGDGIKRPSASEQKNKQVVRKSIVAKTAIQQGQQFSEQNLTIKRPGLGISPMRWNEIIGQRAQKNYQADELI